MDQTFSIIKPDATKRNITGSINKVIEESGLRIIAQKRIKLSNEQAENFYSVHKEKTNLDFCIFHRIRSMNRIFLNV